MSMPDQPLEAKASPCADGQNFFCEEAWAGIASKLNLSQRQVETVRCVVAGEGDKEIAHRLDLSRRTVQTHMGRLYEKLAIGSRVELMTRVFAAYRIWRTEANPPAGCPQNTRLESF